MRSKAAAVYDDDDDDQGNDSSKEVVESTPGEAEEDPERRRDGGAVVGDTSSRMKRGDRRVMLAEEALLRADAAPEVVPLRHPRSSQPASFLLDREDQNIREIVVFQEDNRSWFVDDTVCSDGRIFLASSFDPLFLLLPYLRAANRLAPLDQVAKDPDFPALRRVVNSTALTKNLDKVASRKGTPDLNVWQYDEEKTLSYLSDKAKRVSAALKEKKENIKGGEVSESYVKSLHEVRDEREYLRYAHGMLLEYLEPDLGERLKERLGISKEEETKTNKTKASDEAGGIKKKSKYFAQQPDEDYSKDFKLLVASKKESPQDAKQKALARSASGTKNITSFFKKK